jgi:hypothetical protein
MASLVSFYEKAPIRPPDSEKLAVEQYPLTDATRFELGYPDPGVAYVRHPPNAHRED